MRWGDEEAHHSLPPSIRMSPGSMYSFSIEMVLSTGAPALTRNITRLQHVQKVRCRCPQHKTVASPHTLQEVCSPGLFQGVDEGSELFIPVEIFTQACN